MNFHVSQLSQRSDGESFNEDRSELGLADVTPSELMGVLENIGISAYGMGRQNVGLLKQGKNRRGRSRSPNGAVEAG